MKCEDIRTISSPRVCVIFTAVDLPISDILVALRKEFPVAKHQNVTPTRFSVGLAF